MTRSLLLVFAEPGRVGIFATATPAELLAEIGREVVIDTHYKIASAGADAIEREVRRTAAHLQLDPAGKWFAMGQAEALFYASQAAKRLGADTPVISGKIYPKNRCGGAHPRARAA